MKELGSELDKRAISILGIAGAKAWEYVERNIGKCYHRGEFTKEFLKGGFLQEYEEMKLAGYRVLLFNVTVEDRKGIVAVYENNQDENFVEEILKLGEKKTEKLDKETGRPVQEDGKKKEGSPFFALPVSEDYMDTLIEIMKKPKIDET